MSAEIVAEAWQADCGSHTDKLVLLALAENAGVDGGEECIFDAASLSWKCCIDTRALIRSLDRLKSLGHITITATPGHVKVHPNYHSRG